MAIKEACPYEIDCHPGREPCHSIQANVVAGLIIRLTGHP
jgi:hypothetical protein